jgi:hypothetical protein
MDFLKWILLGGAGYLVYRAYESSQVAAAPGGSTPAVSAVPGVPASYPASVSLANLGGSGAAGGSGSLFYVGDIVQVRVSGPPNQPVNYTAVVNGVAQPAGTLGTTAADGTFTWSAPVPASLVGSITENWSVGSTPIGQVSFVVKTAPAGVAGLGAAGRNLPMTRGAAAAILRARVHRGIGNVDPIAVGVAWRAAHGRHLGSRNYVHPATPMRPRGVL